jgi:hypothetical protein
LAELRLPLGTADIREGRIAADDSLEGRLDKGWVLYGAGKIGLARLVFENACMAYSGAFEAHFGLAICLKGGGEKATAIKEFEEARKSIRQGGNPAHMMMLRRMIDAHLNHLRSGKWSGESADAE